jgi:hypothetical protein
MEKEVFYLFEKKKNYNVKRIHEITNKKMMFGKYININNFINQLSIDVW